MGLKGSQTLRMEMGPHQALTEVGSHQALTEPKNRQKVYQPQTIPGVGPDLTFMVPNPGPDLMRADQGGDRAGRA